MSIVVKGFMGWWCCAHMDSLEKWRLVVLAHKRIRHKIEKLEELKEFLGKLDNRG